MLSGPWDISGILEDQEYSRDQCKFGDFWTCWEGTIPCCFCCHYLAEANSTWAERLVWQNPVLNGFPGYPLMMALKMVSNFAWMAPSWTALTT